MFKLLWPLYLIKKLNKMYKEIINLIFYYKSVDELHQRNILLLNKLKVDKLRRVYTFFNLKPELLLHEKDVLMDQEKMYVGNHILKIQNIFSEHDLYELIKFRYKRIQTDDFYGYKIHGYFYFREVTVWWILWYAVYIFGIIKLINWIDWSVFTPIIQKIGELFM